MNHVEKSLTLALYTATQWHSDKAGNGLALLSLGSTRKVHTEEHRRQCISEINHNIEYVENRMEFEQDESTGETAEELREHEVLQLEALRHLVEITTIGKEWLTDSDNMRFNEELYRNNELR